MNSQTAYVFFIHLSYLETLNKLGITSSRLVSNNLSAYVQGTYSQGVS